MTAGATRDPSPGELADDLAELKAMLAALTAKIDSLPYLRVDVYEARHTSLRDQIALQLADYERRMKQLEDRSTWVARAAITGVLLPVIVALVVGVLLAGGGS